MAAEAQTRVPHFSRDSCARSGDSRQHELETSAVYSSNVVPAIEVTATRTILRERRQSLILPREHGAWFLLLVPMITGAGIAFHESNRIFPALLLLVAALALFWLRTPVESLLGTSAIRVQTKDERQVVGTVIAGLVIVATLALGALLWAWQNPLLWLIGAAAGAAFVGQALLKLMWRQPPRLSSQGEARHPLSKPLAQRLRMLSEIVGTLGLTASAPAAYYVITGNFGATAWMLWAANLIFAGNQIHYVQLRIHNARIEGLRAKLSRGWAFAAGQFVMTVVLIVACLSGLLPRVASIAFAPLLFRGWFYFIQKPAPLKVRRLGWNELAQAVTFCVLFIAVFALPK